MSVTLKVEVYHAKSLKQLAVVDLDSGKTVGDVKKAVASQSKSFSISCRIKNMSVYYFNLFIRTKVVC